MTLFARIRRWLRWHEGTILVLGMLLFILTASVLISLLPRLTQ